MASRDKYLKIVEHYEDCLETHGDSHLGVDWPNAADAETRYKVMLELLGGANRSKEPVSVLDFGCGASHLYDYLQKNGFETLQYSGLDISAKYLKLSKEKHPDVKYYCLDILKADQAESLPVFDYVIMNGVFTERQEMSFDEMLEYFKALVGKAFEHARLGLAFNVMSKHVDWERDDLFHLPFDTLAEFLKKQVSPHFAFRQDYGLFEYTTYIYRSRD